MSKNVTEIIDKTPSKPSSREAVITNNYNAERALTDAEASKHYGVHWGDATGGWGTGSPSNTPETSKPLRKENGKPREKKPTVTEINNTQKQDVPEDVISPENRKRFSELRNNQSKTQEEINEMAGYIQTNKLAEPTPKKGGEPVATPVEKKDPAQEEVGENIPAESMTRQYSGKEHTFEEDGRTVKIPKDAAYERVGNETWAEWKSTFDGGPIRHRIPDSYNPQEKQSTPATTEATAKLATREKERGPSVAVKWDGTNTVIDENGAEIRLAGGEIHSGIPTTGESTKIKGVEAVIDGKKRATTPTPTPPIEIRERRDIPKAARGNGTTTVVDFNKPSAVVDQDGVVVSELGKSKIKEAPDGTDFEGTTDKESDDASRMPSETEKEELAAALDMRRKYAMEQRASGESISFPETQGIISKKVDAQDLPKEMRQKGGEDENGVATKLDNPADITPGKTQADIDTVNSILDTNSSYRANIIPVTVGGIPQAYDRGLGNFWKDLTESTKDEKVNSNTGGRLHMVDRADALNKNRPGFDPKTGEGYFGDAELFAVNAQRKIDTKVFDNNQNNDIFNNADKKIGFGAVPTKLMHQTLGSLTMAKNSEGRYEVRDNTGQSMGEYLKYADGKSFVRVTNEAFAQSVGVPVGHYVGENGEIHDTEGNLAGVIYRGHARMASNLNN